jgi:hypothetical protein
MARPPLARDGWTRADALVASLIVVAGAGMALESDPLGAGAGVVLEGGVLGVGIAAAVAVAWLVAGTPYAFVVGQVGLVVGLDGGPTTTPVTQTALVLLLIADVAVGRTYAAASVAVATVTIGVLLLVDRAAANALVAGLLMVAAAGVAVYGIHRYERVALGLAGDSE